MSQTSDNDSECSVCLQKYMQPVSLPCHHVFCFLCAKGMLIHSQRCALCRKVIPDNYLSKPTVVADAPSSPTQNTHRWFYQGHRGWWQYDQRSNNDIEEAFIAKKDNLKVMLSGFIYVIDLTRMVQFREMHPQRFRGIKRDLCNIPDNKGVAGLAVSLLNGAGGSKVGQGGSGNVGQGGSGNVGQSVSGNVGQSGSGNVGQCSSGNVGQSGSGNEAQGILGNIGQGGSVNVGQGGNVSQGCSGNVGQGSSGNVGQGDSGNIDQVGNVGQSGSGNVGQVGSGYIGQDGLKIISQGGSGYISHDDSGYIGQVGSENLGQVISGGFNVCQRLSVHNMDKGGDDEDDEIEYDEDEEVEMVENDNDDDEEEDDKQY